ncbi:MAG: lycopene cyclase family protein, partial [Polyangiaceae bacterium]
MTYDMLVMGAGSAGAAVSAFAAEAGFSVLCVDRRPLAECGARWVNDAPRWMLDEAGVTVPYEAQFGHHQRFHMFAGWSRTKVSANAGDTVAIDMPKLVALLQSRAMRAGAELRGESRVVFERHDGTVSIDGRVIDARYVVDASGLAGVAALGELHTRPEDMCAAAQQVHRVADMAAARAFFESWGIAPNEIAVFTGVAGGYSIVNVRLVDDCVGLLTGSIPADGHPSGRELLDRFLNEHSWVGEKVFGGARAIPLTHARGRLVRGHVIAIGDA